MTEQEKRDVQGAIECHLWREKNGAPNPHATRAARLADVVTCLDAELIAARAMLRTLQWSAEFIQQDIDPMAARLLRDCCPVFKRQKEEGHLPDCGLAKLIGD